MFTYITGFKTNCKKDKWLENFRHRSTTRWTVEEREETEKIHRNLGIITTNTNSIEDSDAPASSSESYLESFHPAKIKSIAEKRHFTHHQKLSLTKLFSSEDSSPLVQLLPTIHQSPFHYLKNYSAPDIENASLPLPQITKILQQDRYGRRNSMKLLGQTYIDNRKLSNSQTLVVNRVFRYFCELDDKITGTPRPDLHPPTILLTCEPGSGKSYTIETFCELATTMNLGYVATTSYNGIAAVNVDGITLHKMFSLPAKADNDSVALDKLEILRHKLNLNVLCMLIVDEVSTIDTGTIPS